MRFLPLLTLLLGMVVRAQTDARHVFLLRQLGSAQDPRARAQAALTLGAEGEAFALPALCRALGDGSPLVRAAVAKALPALHELGALECLQAHGRDADAGVHTEVMASLSQLRAVKERHPRVYLAVDAVADRNGAPLSTPVTAFARGRLVSRLQWMGAQVAPADESPVAARGVLRALAVRGFLLKPALVQEPGGGLELNAVCLTYPDLQVLGEVTVRASGARAEDLVKALVPRLLQEADATFDLDLAPGTGD